MEQKINYQYTYFIHPFIIEKIYVKECYKMSKNVREKDQKRALHGWIKNIY